MVEIISCCWILMELIAALLFLGIFLQNQKWKWTTFVIVAGLWFFLFIYTNYINIPMPTVFVTASVYFLLSFIGYKGSWARHLIASIMCVLLLAIIDTLIIYTSSVLLDISLDELYTKKYLYLTIVTISKGLSLLFMWISWKLKVGKKQLQLQMRGLVLTCLFPAVSLTMLVVVFESFQHSNDVSLDALVFTVAILIGNIAIIYIIQRLEKAEKELFQGTLLSQQMEVQTKSIIALEKSYRAQRKAAHDFNHHLNTISALLLKKQYNTATKYISQLCDQHTSRVFCINSHNPIIDAILNQKYQLASELGIDMQFKVNDLSNIPIATDSIVVLLSNLLDNAIEACNKCTSSKSIHFSMISNSTIFLTIDNTSPPVSIIKGEIATTKDNKDDHGYGLLNVKRILHDLDAEFAFQYNNGWFSFVAEIPNK